MWEGKQNKKPSKVWYDVVIYSIEHFFKDISQYHFTCNVLEQYCEYLVQHFAITEYYKCKQKNIKNVHTECTFQIRMLNDERPQVCGNNLGIYLPRASHHIPVLSGLCCFVLIFLFLFSSRSNKLMRHMKE